MAKNGEIKIFFLVVAFISVAAVLITIFTHLPEKKQEELIINENLTEQLSYEDFVIPDEFKLDFSQEIIKYRESPEKWSWPQVEEYWTDPKAMALDYVKKENDKALEEIFDKVP